MNHRWCAWLNDANIRYLEGKYIPLLVVGLQFLFCVAFPPIHSTAAVWSVAPSVVQPEDLVLDEQHKLKAFFDSYS